MTVRVRFAPSPTGHPHIGNIRTVIFNWLYARQNHGKFILRIEDTDQTRYVPNAVQVITDSLRWLGLDWDEGPDVGGPYGPYVQSQRLALYKEKAEELIERGWAYRCNCTPERLERVREAQRARGLPPMYDGHCRELAPDAISPDEPHVIRLKIPREGQTVVHDLLKGDIAFENALIDDQVLLKSDGYPTYHLAVVVDDHMMDITHIIRADEWLPSTPKHVLIYQAFEWEAPTFVHVPLVMGDDGKKLSKRHGAASVDDFRKQGYVAEAVFNFLTLLGWAPGEGEEQEIFSREELIEHFDLHHINLAPAVFAYDKLDWMNGVYIRAMSEEALLERLIPFWQEAGLIPAPVPAEMMETLRILVPLVQERLKRLQDVVELTDFIFNDIETASGEALLGKNMTPEQSLEALKAAHTLLSKTLSFDAETLEPQMRQLAEDLGLKTGQLFTIIRVAVSNKKVAPPLFGSIEALGRQTTLKRIARAEEALVHYIEQKHAASA
ncbi:MAG: glutamate--tRNA ligase [Anaerolineae bacterium]|jgi:glutamyl-tRNA synthetase|nr:glutamate--tRNA ligase [Anaerolineae bacterium]